MTATPHPTNCHVTVPMLQDPLLSESSSARHKLRSTISLRTTNGTALLSPSAYLVNPMRAHTPISFLLHAISWDASAPPSIDHLM